MHADHMEVRNGWRQGEERVVPRTLTDVQDRNAETMCAVTSMSLKDLGKKQNEMTNRQALKLYRELVKGELHLKKKLLY